MRQKITDGGRDPPQPEYGRRLIIDVVDNYAANEPSRPFAYTPVSGNPKDGWKPISYKELSNAVNHVAHEIVRRATDYGLQDNDFPTVAYIGPNDVRYAIFMLACIKAQHKAFFMSPRNSLEGQLSLLKATNCSILYYAESHLQIVLPWLEMRPMRLIKAPNPDVWLQSTPPAFPYIRLFDEGKWDPLVVLHTSGSSGLPKPIIVRQGSFAIADGLRNGPDLHGAPSLWEHWGSTATKFFLPMPLFHAAGIAHISSTGIYYGSAIVFGITDRPMNADLVAESLLYSGADGTILPPSIIEDLAQSEEGISVLASLKFTGFAGGSMAPKVGDLMARRGVMLSNLIASTECMPYTLHCQYNPRLWQYFIINSKEMGAEFRPVSWDAGTYEMILCHDNPHDPGRKAFVYTFPDKTEWSTGDLFRPHPTLPDHWAYHGRADDTITFSSGEKLHPIAIEEAVSSHPAIKGALVVGSQKFQPALILEPVEAPTDQVAAEALLDDIWPLVEQANEITVAHGRIFRELVVLSDSTKPFLRAAKGSIQRSSTVRAYSEFIDQVYQQAEERMPAQQHVLLDLASKESLTQSIVNILVSEIGNIKVDSDTDLFSVGVDSLQIMRLSRLLRSGLGAAGVSMNKNILAPRVMYASRTPAGLAGYILAAITGKPCQGETSQDVEALAEMVSKYTADLPSPNNNQSDPLDDGQTILVSGTTGSLGAYILDSLISSHRVKKIIGLNRGEDGGRLRQSTHNSARGLTTDFSKVEFLCTDLSLPTWGLSQLKYSELLATADRIIHNAWPVNFIINIASFETHIRGVRRLVDFSNKAAKRVPILFISSISTVDGWQASEMVPERQLDNLKLPLMGYGQSKLAGSLILDAAVERSGVPAATVRVGQIGGPLAKTGVWNQQEFIPSLIASSLHLGVLPDSLGRMDVVDWMAVEDVVGLILDVMGLTIPTHVSNIQGYFHGVNPSTTSWPEVAATLMNYYDGRIKQIVPLEEWVATLEASAESADAEKNPAIKLTDTYQGILSDHRAGVKHVYFEMERTMIHSPTMRNLGPVSMELVKNWCEQWNY